MEGVLDLLTKNEIIKIYKKYNRLDEIFATDYARFSSLYINWWFWTKNSHLGDAVTANKYSINNPLDGKNHFRNEPTNCKQGILPVIKGKNYDKLISGNQSDIIELYEYPKTMESNSMSSKLDSLLANDKLIKTGRTFENHIEYYYNNNKYIVVLAKEFFLKVSEQLRDEKRESEWFDGKTRAWFKVEKIQWINLIEQRILLCNNILNTEIFNQKPYYGAFRNTQIYQTLCQMYKDMSTKLSNKDLLNEIISSDIAIQMLMNKENINIEDLEIEGDSKLVLRR